MAGLTLSAANVVVPPESAADEPGHASVPVGEFAAITLRGPGDWSPDWTWSPQVPVPVALPAGWRKRLPCSGARFAYGRALAGESSVTVFLPRFVAVPVPGDPGDADPG